MIYPTLFLVEGMVTSIKSTAAMEFLHPAPEKLRSWELGP